MLPLTAICSPMNSATLPTRLRISLTTTIIMSSLQTRKALLVWLPRSIDCIVMLGSQLNRDKKRVGWQDYKLDALRESGAIEQDAFGVFFIHRDDAEENDDSKHNGEADIVIGKVRQGGKKGRVQMKFNGPSTCFYEPDDYETAYPED